MTTRNAYRWVMALLLLCGCSSTHVDEEGSSGSHWLACDDDDECEDARADATCGDEGYCVDPFGERIRVMLSDAGGSGGDGGETGGAGGEGGSGGTQSGGAGGAGGGGSGGASGADAGPFEPCAGLRCGDPCSNCAPGDLDCTDTTEPKTCDALGVCTGTPHDCPVQATPECGAVVAGDDCSYPGDESPPQCCADAQLLSCMIVACTDGIPGSCFGAYEETRSTLCNGYRPCAGKACGESCEICDPADRSCVPSDAVQTCDSAGECVIGGVMCPEPVPCDLDGTGPDVCGRGETCCAIGRCGPVEQDQGYCEPADPDTGACKRCECETEPGGCPICNSPDTPIATPDGERAIAELVEGDLVLSMHNGVLMPVPVLALRSVLVHDHAVVRVELDSGRFIEVSGSHPTAEGRRLDAVAPGDALGDARVVSVELVPYAHERTYDILPASDSGTYLAGGALLGSTLAR